MIRLRNIALAAALGAAACLGSSWEPHQALAADTSSMADMKDMPASDAGRKILYYRNPMGLADTSPVPKKDSMGMEYVPVYADEEQPASPPAESVKGKILYYRAPMGTDTSPVMKKDSMGMDYVPVYESEAKESAGGTVRLTPERVQRLGVKSEAVEHRDLSHTIHAVGTVQIDEAKQKVIAPRYEGYIEKLAVNTTGQKVKKGDVLLTFYSPQLVQIENEYLVSRIEGGDAKSVKANGSLEKLRTLAVPDEEIQRLQREKTVNNSIALRAPAEGTVLEKQAIDGMKFAPGDTLYKLADLSDVWVIARIYEKDLAQVSMGQTVAATVSTYPNRIFNGKVAFIYPDIDTDTRTAKVRLELPNPDGDLRLAMFANVKIDSPTEKNALSIPASAVLNSGEKQSVLVDLGGGRFRSQPIKLGKHTEDFVEVLDGLKDGDRVVTSASFLIDAESNIRAALQNFSAPEK